MARDSHRRNSLKLPRHPPTARILRSIILPGVIAIALSAVHFAFGQGGTGRETTTKKKSGRRTPSAKKNPPSKSGRDKSDTANASSANIIKTPSGIELVWIPPGSFMMGSETGNPNEKPVHRVTLVVDEQESARARLALPQAETDFQTSRRDLIRVKDLFESRVSSQAEYDATLARYTAAKRALDSLRTVTGEYGFYLGVYEITQAQWQAVMGNNPSVFKNCGGDCPVDGIFWEDAQQFLDKLNDAKDGYYYRLPTEAEWEYACRAGTTTDYAGRLASMGWYGRRWGDSTHPVGQRAPNAFGLYDMHGNVWEWCLDSFHDSYEGAPGNGSAWITTGHEGSGVVRGGSMLDAARSARSSARWGINFPRQFLGYYTYGFRAVAVPRS